MAFNRRGPNDLRLSIREGRLRIPIELPNTPFVPRHAYKALSRMGVAMLPEEETQHYEKLVNWLMDPLDEEDFHILEVGVAMASLGNWPQLAALTLLKRIELRDPFPYLILLVTIGSVSLQIDLLSDSLDEHIPPLPMGQVRVSYKAVLGNPVDGQSVTIDYGAPRFLNWASRSKEPQPFRSLDLLFDPLTRRGALVPSWRTPPNS